MTKQMGKDKYKQLVEKILLSMSKKELIDFAKRNGYISTIDDVEYWKWENWDFDYD